MLNRLRMGLRPDCWAHVGETADTGRVARLLGAAVTARAQIQIVGRRGAGKSVAVRAALAGQDTAIVVEPVRLDRDRLHVGDIATAIVTALSDERPRHTGEARAQQVRRLLGQARRPVMLLLDDAHLLHWRTMRALKRLRELAWRDRPAPLLATVLVSQVDRAADLPEVGLRTATEMLIGLSPDEAHAALRRLRQPPLCDGSAGFSRLARSPRARNWLDLQRLIDDCLDEAIAQGETRVTTGVLDAVLGRPAATAASTAPSAGAIDAALARREGAA